MWKRSTLTKSNTCLKCGSSDLKIVVHAGAINVNDNLQFFDVDKVICNNCNEAVFLWS